MLHIWLVGGFMWNYRRFINLYNVKYLHWLHESDSESRNNSSPNYSPASLLASLNSYILRSLPVLNFTPLAPHPISPRRICLRSNHYWRPRICLERCAIWSKIHNALSVWSPSSVQEANWKSQCRQVSFFYTFGHKVLKDGGIRKTNRSRKDELTFRKHVHADMFSQHDSLMHT